MRSLTCLIGRSYTATMLNRSLRYVCALTAALSVLWLSGVGCSSKTIQYPEDHERYLRIDQAVESLRQSLREERFVGSGLAHDAD